MKKGSKDDYITKDFFLHNLGEFAKDIVAGITALTEDQNKRLDRIEDKLESHDKRLDRIETDIRDVKKDVQDLKWDTVSRSAFNSLKEKVYRHHPGN